ncbi:hypothetical protein RclHR1_09020005 [Rhizophagus clarus]|uniref:Protein kinase domain-containing protein n=1 Tax=Rhizophagus clarus TaxID=94130 RepID=A0A2Z6SPH0_9GLOM|nr:hypothetical protein RclHR1_09020005 [Rhizophagus clarus]
MLIGSAFVSTSNAQETISLPDSEDDIMEIEDDISDSSSDDSIENTLSEKCEKCDEKYIDEDHAEREWCKPCKLNYLKSNFINWTSKNEKIDNYIQKRQLNINKYYDTLLEWIPYNQFYDIKEVNKDDSVTEYSAIWKNGPLYHDEKEWKRYSDQNVILRYMNNLHNSQDIVNEFLDEVNTYLTNFRAKFINIDYIDCTTTIHGISQNPDTMDYIIVFEDLYKNNCKNCGEIYTDVDYEWCKSCQINSFEDDFINWSSENEEIDNFILEKQIGVKNFYDKIFEWIPCDQFIEVKEISKSEFATLYSAIWKGGQLYYDDNDKKLMRKFDEEVVLKCLYNSQEKIDEFLSEVKTYLSVNNDKDALHIYGISRNPDTKDYIMVLQNEYCKQCGEKYTNIYRWCKSCPINYLKNNFTNWTSKNKNIDKLIQEMQLKIKHRDDIVVEWIPSDQFNDIKEMNKSNSAAEYLAIWKDGPLYYCKNENKWMRKSDKEVGLKCIYNSHNNANEFLDEVKSYSIDQNFDGIDKIYGISQCPVTEDYIIVWQDNYCEKCGKKDRNAIDRQQYQINETHKWCRLCQLDYLKKNFVNWTSENEMINNYIQEVQSVIDNRDNIVFEWIPYNQFNDIKKIGQGGFSIIYSAIWKEGPLIYNVHNYNERRYERIPNKKVALKCLFHSQNITLEFLNEIKAYSMNKYANTINVYGMSQNPNTKEYIMVLEYAKGGNFSDWVRKNYEDFEWKHKIDVSIDLIGGLQEIHRNQMVHRDFHVGNILFMNNGIKDFTNIRISDMGLSGKVDDKDKTNIYGVMPYVAPEVLSGRPYTQAADIYSFGMIMYFIIMGRQPFANRAHDEILAWNIVSGFRPGIAEYEGPKCYIDLMKKCWDPNPENRPNATEISDLLSSFEESFTDGKIKPCHYEFETQFKRAEKYRMLVLCSEKPKKDIHPQAIYTSRLLNCTKDIQKYDDKLNEFSDNIAVENLLLQELENPKDEENPKYKNNEFSDSIAVEELFLQLATQL